MARNGVSLELRDFQLGAGVVSDDALSGLCVFWPVDEDDDSVLPSGFGVDDRVKFVGSVRSAEALGILASDPVFGVVHYHVSEFFRLNPNGGLWLGIFDEDVESSFSELDVMQRVAKGSIKQFLVYAPFKSLVGSLVTGLQASVDVLVAKGMPAVVLFQPNYDGDLSALPDLGALQGRDVAVLIGQGLGGRAEGLFDGLGRAVGFGGAVLGLISRLGVGVSAEWVEVGNLAGSVELVDLGFVNGVRLNDVDDSLLELLHSRRYVFGRFYAGVAGSFVDHSATAISGDSDFCFIERSRVKNKAWRLVYGAMVRRLAGPLSFDSSGVLSDVSVDYLEEGALNAVGAMVRNGEVSAVAVSVSPGQAVLQGDPLRIRLGIVPLGTAREIVVEFGFALSTGA